MAQETSVLIGTSKGAFILRPTPTGWSVSGPHCALWPINHVVGDPVTGTIWAGGGNDFHGVGV